MLDFGLAKARDPVVSYAGDDGATITSPAMTMRGVILGTAAYMAPEQAKGKPVDRRADIWAFGCVLYEMLTGQAVFVGDSVTDILAKVIEREPDFAKLPVTVPAHVLRVVRRCLQKDPRQRLQHIGDARLELELKLEPRFADAPARVPGKHDRSRLTRALPWGVALTASLAAGTILWRGAAPRAERVTSIEISYPDGVEGQEVSQSIAISPDGRVVAMVGVKDGVRTLFLRNTDAIDARPLPQPANPVNITFSPTGSQIAAVTASSQLWRVSLDDNLAQVIAADVDLACGLSWSAHAIVFCRAGALWAVAPDGGQARQLTTLDAARGEVSHVAPVTVDDRLVLFTTLGSEAGSERIEAVPVEGGARSVLIERADTPIIASPRQLLFVREGRLMAARFDPDTRVLTAATPLPPALVGSNQGVALRFPAPALSRTGSLLRSASNQGAREVLIVDRQGAARPLGFEDANFANPRLTHDGRRLLLEERSGPAPRVFDMVRGTSLQIGTPGFSPASYATWNSDGTRAVFRRSLLTWVATDGTQAGGTIPLTTLNDFPNAPGPDPASIIVTRVNADTNADVYLVSLTGAYAPRPLVRSRAFDSGGVLSPDGRWLLYQSADSGAQEIYIRGYPALDRAWQISAGGGVQPRWNPSGREIFYRNGTKMLAVAVDFSGREPLLQKPVQLFDQAFASSTGTATPNYDVTADGRFIMLRARADSSRLVLTTHWSSALAEVLEAGSGRK